MTSDTDIRRPRAFATDDPALRAAAAEKVEQPPTDAGPMSARRKRQAARTTVRPTVADLRHGIRWGALLVSGMLGLARPRHDPVVRALSSTVALARQDWVGWIAFSLLCVVGFSAVVLILREIFGMFRLARLGALRKEVTQALEPERCGQRAARRAPA